MYSSLYVEDCEPDTYEKKKIRDAKRPRKKAFHHKKPKSVRNETSPTWLEPHDPGVASRDYENRLDEKFNTWYLNACHAERTRYYASQQPANGLTVVANVV